MNKGFILIELLIATLIASMIGTLLLIALQQTNKFQAAVDNIVTISTRITILHHQLERDIMGAFIPIQALKQTKKKKEKEKKEPLNQVFYSINRNNNLSILTFITTNPLDIYWGTKTGGARPKVARVVYRLQLENTKKDIFVLLRQEGSELSFASYKIDNPKAPRAYQLIDGIKHFSVIYLVKEKQDEAKKEPPIYKKVKEWHWPSSDQEKTEPILPNFVEVNVVLWDNDHKRDVPFTFVFAIITADTQQEKEQQPLKAKPEQTMKQQAAYKRSTHRNRRDRKTLTTFSQVSSI